MTAYYQFIGGKRVTSQATFDVINPGNGTVAGICPRGSADDMNAAVAAASGAFQDWRKSSDVDRVKACNDMARVLEENAEELATLLTLEQGKPLGGLGSRFELGGCIGWLKHTAGLSLPVEVLQNDDAAHIELHRKPIGVVASITPWNWPLMIAIWHIGPAIRTGNTVVVKPSPLTPLSTLRMVELLNTVLPAGVLNVVAGLDDIGPVLTNHPSVGKITFTGSTVTGKKVMYAATDTLKRLTLELGGNDAAILLPDVDIDLIVEKLFWGAFINNGQTCACLKRLYVHDEIYDKVCDALVAYSEAIPVGYGLDENNVLGPIQNKAQFDKIVAMVEDATSKGARVLTGGKATGGEGYFYPLTILSDAKTGMRVVDEEQFGPVLPILRYTNVEDAINEANQSDMGLGGSVWSGDAELAKSLVQQLECGISWVNSHGGLHPNAPFGGVKQSGFGVEFGLEGLKEFTTSQTTLLHIQ